MVGFPCQHCGSRVKAPASLAGKTGKCPRCGGRSVVPDVSATPGTKPALDNCPRYPGGSSFLRGLAAGLLAATVLISAAVGVFIALGRGDSEVTSGVAQKPVGPVGVPAGAPAVADQVLVATAAFNPDGFAETVTWLQSELNNGVSQAIERNNDVSLERETNALEERLLGEMRDHEVRWEFPVNAVYDGHFTFGDQGESWTERPPKIKLTCGEEYELNIIFYRFMTYFNPAEGIEMVAQSNPPINGYVMITDRHVNPDFVVGLGRGDIVAVAGTIDNVHVHSTTSMVLPARQRTIEIYVKDAVPVGGEPAILRDRSISDELDEYLRTIPTNTPPAFSGTARGRIIAAEYHLRFANLAWDRGDPDDYTFRRYRDVVEKYPGTPAAAEAAAQIGRLHER